MFSVPPWSDQKAGKFAQSLSWVFVVVSLVALLIVVEGALNTNLSSYSFRQVASFTIGLVCSVYLFFVFLHVARHGRAPKSWIPW